MVINACWVTCWVTAFVFNMPVAATSAPQTSAEQYDKMDGPCRADAEGNLNPNGDAALETLWLWHYDNYLRTIQFKDELGQTEILTKCGHICLYDTECQGIEVIEHPTDDPDPRNQYCEIWIQKPLGMGNNSDYKCWVKKNDATTASNLLYQTVGLNIGGDGVTIELDDLSSTIYSSIDEMMKTDNLQIHSDARGTQVVDMTKFDVVACAKEQGTTKELKLA